MKLLPVLPSQLGHDIVTQAVLRPGSNTIWITSLALVQFHLQSISGVGFCTNPSLKAKLVRLFGHVLLSKMLPLKGIIASSTLRCCLGLYKSAHLMLKRSMIGLTLCIGS